MSEMASELNLNDSVFVVGEVYYYVTYPDVEMPFPLIESYVVLGRNASDDYAIDGSAVTGN